MARIKETSLDEQNTIIKWQQGNEAKRKISTVS